VSRAPSALLHSSEPAHMWYLVRSDPVVAGQPPLSTGP
jgi:hypothetical protein